MGRLVSRPSKAYVSAMTDSPYDKDKEDRPESSGEDHQDSYLAGQLLIAMPTMTDPRFAKTVVFLCAHNDQGAMGLVVNKLVGSLSFAELMRQMDIEMESDDEPVQVHFGGPVESTRGFVLHTPDYESNSTLVVDDQFALTSTVDVLRSIAGGRGPARAILALGYAGWAPGQLDEEIQANGWLHVDADQDLVFGDDLDNKWNRAIAKMGFDPSFLSLDAGHA